jgi:chromosome segregation ATPase
MADPTHRREAAPDDVTPLPPLTESGTALHAFVVRSWQLVDTLKAVAQACLTAAADTETAVTTTLSDEALTRELVAGKTELRQLRERTSEERAAQAATRLEYERLISKAIPQLRAELTQLETELRAVRDQVQQLAPSLAQVVEAQDQLARLQAQVQELRESRNQVATSAKA